MNSLLYDNP